MERAEILRRWYGGDNCKIPSGYLLDILSWPVYAPTMKIRIFERDFRN